MEDSHGFGALLRVAGPFPVAAVAVWGAVELAQYNVLLSGGSLLIALVAFAFGVALLVRREPVSGPDDARGPTALAPSPPEPAVLESELTEVASPEVRELNRPRTVNPLEWVIYLHLKSKPNTGLGRNGQTPARYFVDLREAALQRDHLSVMVDAMVAHISRVAHPHTYRGVVLPKEGNPVFGIAVAHALDLQPIVVREWEINGTYIETNLKRGRVFLLDDIWSDAEVLLAAADKARRAGFNLADVFLLVQRSEGRMRDELAGQRLNLNSSLLMGDEDLARLEDRAKQAIAALLALPRRDATVRNE